MMRDEGRAQSQDFSDVADAVLAVAKKGDNASPGRLSNCLETEHDLRSERWCERV